MGLSVYVDGPGGSDSGYGYFVKETGESFYGKKPELTNNQAEYMAIISALNKYVDSDEEIIIYSDSKNTVNQLNHEFAINNEQLRDLARQAWSVIGKFSNLSSVDSSKREFSRKNAGKLKSLDQKFL